VDPVIKGIVRLEFEDGLRMESSLETAGTLVAAAPSPGSILHHLGVRVGLRGGVVVTKTPVGPYSNSTEFLTSLVSKYSCCSVRIELAIGSPP